MDIKEAGKSAGSHRHCCLKEHASLPFIQAVEAALLALEACQLSQVFNANHGGLTSASQNLNDEGLLGSAIEKPRFSKTIISSRNTEVVKSPSTFYFTCHSTEQYRQRFTRHFKSKLRTGWVNPCLFSANTSIWSVDRI